MISASDREWFLSPRPPRELFERSDEIRQTLGPKCFFNQAGLSWLREAWNIGRFGIATKATSVRLNPADPPDGYIMFPERALPVEVTEALEPGRRRGREYKTPTLGGATSIEQNRIEFFEENFGSWVATAALRKLNTQARLPRNTIILINLSAWLFFLSPDKIFGRLIEVLPEPSGNVSGFAVIHNREVYLPEGLAADRIVSIEGAQPRMSSLPPDD